MDKVKTDSRALSSPTKLPQIVENIHFCVNRLQFLVKRWGQRCFRRGRGGDTELYASQVMINPSPEVHTYFAKDLGSSEYMVLTYILPNMKISLFFK